MAKYRCEECGHITNEYYGRCPNYKNHPKGSEQWNTLEELAVDNLLRKL